MDIPQDNVIEWINGDQRVLVSFYQKKYVNKIRKLAKLYPKEITNLVNNSDGSICASIPINYIKISHPRAMTEEQKQKAGERMRASRK